MQETKDLLVGLLNYVEAVARMTERAVFSVHSYRTLAFFEHELHNRVGIQHDTVGDDGPIWLQIERLPRTDPPTRESGIAAWLTVSRDPNRPSQVIEERLETMSRTEAQVCEVY